MTADAVRAAQIYAQLAEIGANAPRGEGAEAAARPNFGDLVQSAVAETTASLQAGDAAANAVAAGEASLVDVVTAVSAAEVALETAVAVRNRMIEAYQEILRMPI